MLRGATFRAPAMAGTAVFRMVVSNDSMKRMFTLIEQALPGAKWLLAQGFSVATENPCANNHLAPGSACSIRVNIRFMESLDTTILNTAVPAIAGALKVAPLSMKSVLASYTLSLAVFIPISGWMADRFGTRRVFGSAIGLFT